eukprot:GHVU01052943.1.p1 GENE.GHVU01052943.1~~GHVU01052943.1.p1  ORF type:complete len:128 (+),score=2.27 GHVU01052943.1:370-753(+)
MMIAKFVISISSKVSTTVSEVAHIGAFFLDSGFSFEVMPLSGKGATFWEVAYHRLLKCVISLVDDLLPTHEKSAKKIMGRIRRCILCNVYEEVQPRLSYSTYFQAVPRHLIHHREDTHWNTIGSLQR